jgi:hypothetical protein
MATKKTTTARVAADSQLVAKSREPGQRWDLYDKPPGAAELFADGVAGILLGPVVSKLHLFSAIGFQDTTAEGPIEQRKLTAIVTIPTSNLLAFCQSTLEGMKANAEALARGVDEQKQKFDSLRAPDKPERKTH